MYTGAPRTGQGKGRPAPPPRDVFLAVETRRYRFAALYDPLLAMNTSEVDPLPHQIEAVYGYILKLPRIRFLIADDPGAGKTIMAGLIIKELKLRHLVKRILIVAPGHLKDQWRRERLGEARYQRACAKLEAALDRLLAGEYADPDNTRLEKLLRKHRDQLLTFLSVDGLAPANNAAERAIRPAVVVRKTSGDNRRDRGAATHAVLTSIIRTC